MPIKIERQLQTIPPSANPWVDVTTNFTYSISGRDVILTAKPAYYWYSPYYYRITPIRSGNETLKCDDVDGNPAVYNYTYKFYIKT